MALGIAQQLRDLASVEENRHFIVKDHGCLPGLIGFIEHEEEEVRMAALDALEMLSSEPKNWQLMKDEEGMQEALDKIQKSEGNGKEKAHVILTNIKKLEKEGLELTTTTLATSEVEEKENASGVEFEETVITTTTTTTKRKVKAKGSRGQIDADIRPLRSRTNKDARRKPKRKPKTFTIYILGLALESDREKVEKALLAKKGVISFLIDLSEHKVVVRAVISGEAIIETIATSGYEASFDKPELPTAIIDYLDDDEDDEEANKMGIVEHGGACNSAEKDEGWIGWGSRIGRALWG